MRHCRHVQNHGPRVTPHTLKPPRGLLRRCWLLICSRRDAEQPLENWLLLRQSWRWLVSQVGFVCCWPTPRLLESGARIASFFRGLWKQPTSESPVIAHSRLRFLGLPYTYLNQHPRLRPRYIWIVNRHSRQFCCTLKHENHYRGSWKCRNIHTEQLRISVPYLSLGLYTSGIVQIAIRWWLRTQPRDKLCSWCKYIAVNM